LSFRPVRLAVSLAILALLTFSVRGVVDANATTAGFLYLLLVLVIASTWGFWEAAILSVAAALSFNYFSLPPIGTFTIADPQNWIALFSFLTTSLIASRLSTEARRRALDAVERQQDLERLYSFSRAILLIESFETLPLQLVCKLADIFELSGAVLYDRRSGEFYRAGPSDVEGLDDKLREAVSHGTSFSDSRSNRIVTSVRLGSEPIAGLGLQGARMPDAVLQGIANLVAIGLERARAQDLAHQIEVARRSEQLRATLIDAMAHEFKTPLTSIKAATTMLLASPGLSLENRTEMLKVADEEAERLRNLIDNSVEMARLDTTQINLNSELSDVSAVIEEVVSSLRTELEARPVQIDCDRRIPEIPFDRRLMKLAIKQLLDNALKYSPGGTPLKIQVHQTEDGVGIEISDYGKGIPPQEQGRIFERFYRGPSVHQNVPGSGLGLNIAYNIVRAHHGNLTVTSRLGETTFRLTLPSQYKGERA
jgi:two-component system sensor histidine kinase KdpD